MLNIQKLVLYGDGENETNKENAEELLAHYASGNLLALLLEHVPVLEFEARKDFTHIFNFFIRTGKDNKRAVEYVQTYPQVLRHLIRGMSMTEQPDIVFSSSEILREVIRYDALCHAVMHDDSLFLPFFSFCEVDIFDIQSDALRTFKIILTKHRKMFNKYIDQNFDKFFTRFNELLTSDDYALKRQALKTLGELLLNRDNYSVMMKYINIPTNLILIMNLLRSKSQPIQLDAFDVFKIFVANPKKSPQIAEILIMNRANLLTFLGRFQKVKDDEQFNDEKQILLDTLQGLTLPEGYQPSTPATFSPSTSSAAAAGDAEMKN